MDLFTAAKSVKIEDVYAFYAGTTAKIRKGRKSTAVVCPFHEDKRPSLNLYPNNTFYCFSCHAGGSNIDLVMKLKSVDSYTAAKTICDDFNIPYEDTRKNIPSQQEQEAKRILKTNRLLCDIFKSRLATSPHPDFFDNRGVGSLTDEFEFGYCPTEKLFKNIELGMEMALCDEKGVCVFAGRYIIPIKDAADQVIGFIGRASDEDVAKLGVPKYINSANSLVFRKREVLFHPQGLRTTDGTVIVTEGALDALSFIAAGVRSVVSILGTSMSDQHIEKLARTGKSVTLAFDNDQAGTEAMRKAFSYVKKLRLNVIADGYGTAKDANELIVTQGTSAIGQLLFHMKEAPLYIINEAESSGKLGTVAGQEDTWIRLAKLLGTASPSYTDRYPINTAYAPPAHMHYWGVFKAAIAAHPIK